MSTSSFFTQIEKCRKPDITANLSQRPAMGKEERGVGLVHTYDS